MSTIQLHRVDLSTPVAVEAFSDILQPLLPYSVPILGSLYSGDIHPQDGLRGLDVWTSFPFERSTPPSPLFSVIAYSEFNDKQLRFFCSAETRLGPPTKDEEEHVRSVLDSFVHALKTKDAVVEGIDCEKALERENGEGIFIGSLNDRWASFLYAGMHWKPPLIIIVLIPDEREDEPAWDAYDGEWEVTEIRESDIDFILSRAVFPRTPQFVKSRIPYSVCVRRRGEPEGSPPVAWELMYSDGSSGMLHVESEYRRAGLARKCVEALATRMAQRYRTDDEKLQGRYPHKRWEMTEVVMGNTAGLQLAMSRKGWKHTWMTHWGGYPGVHSH